MAALLLTAGPFTPPASAQQAAPTTLRVAMVTQIDHLNPFTSTSAAGTQMGRLMYEFLTLPSAENAQPVPALAERWEPSPDKLTWTFTIRQGMKWSDGKPITAADPAYTFNRMLTDENARTANGNYVANFESVSAPNPQTLMIKTKTPQANMLALDVPIVPEHVWKNVTDMADPKTDEPPMVTSGPFKLTEYKKNQSVSFEANKEYWRGAPKIDKLQFLKFENADAAVNALKNNEVDLINRLNQTQFDSLKNVAGVSTNKAPGRRYNELIMNPGATTSANQPIGDGHPALKDVRVRKAIARAIDTKTIVDRVMGGYAQVGASVIPPVFRSYHWEPTDPERYKFDLGAANAALDAAGYPRGADGVRAAPDGRKLEFRLLGHSSRNFDQRTTEYVTGWLRDVGITVKPQLVSDNEVDEGTTTGAYDLAISGWATNPDPEYALSLQICASRPNAAGSGGTTAANWCDPEFDALYQQQLAEFDPVKRADIVKRAQARHYDQVPGVVLDYDNALEAYRSDRFASFTKQPQPEGVIMEQSGYWGYYGATPGSAQAGGGNGGSPVVWIVVGAVVVLILVGGGIALSRRGKSAEDRE